jgi:predicted amidophosphoribosyltransferase
MTDEVYTACPACDAEIPFYRTVDELRACPECDTPSDELFDMAIGSEPIEPAAEPDETLLLADGGRDE